MNIFANRQKMEMAAVGLRPCKEYPKLAAAAADGKKEDAEGYAGAASKFRSFAHGRRFRKRTQGRYFRNYSDEDNWPLGGRGRIMPPEHDAKNFAFQVVDFHVGGTGLKPDTNADKTCQAQTGTHLID